jgi:transcriptional regulator with XRE-family HTH domain
VNPETLTEAEKVQRRLGGRVAQARREAGLTQKQLADRIGTSLGQVVKLEDGVLAGVPMLSRIAAATGHSVESFAVPGLSVEVLIPQRSEQPADLLFSRIAKLEDEVRTLTEQLGQRDRALAELEAALEHRTAETEGALSAPRPNGRQGADQGLARGAPRTSLVNPKPSPERNHHCLRRRRLAMLGESRSNQAATGRSPMAIRSLLPNAITRTTIFFWVRRLLRIPTPPMNLGGHRDRRRSRRRTRRSRCLPSLPRPR